MALECVGIAGELVVYFIWYDEKVIDANRYTDKQLQFAIPLGTRRNSHRRRCLLSGLGARGNRDEQQADLLQYLREGNGHRELAEIAFPTGRDGYPGSSDQLCTGSWKLGDWNSETGVRLSAWGYNFLTFSEEHPYQWMVYHLQSRRGSMMKTRSLLIASLLMTSFFSIQSLDMALDFSAGDLTKLETFLAGVVLEGEEVQVLFLGQISNQWNIQLTTAFLYEIWPLLPESPSLFWGPQVKVQFGSLGSTNFAKRFQGELSAGFLLRLYLPFPEIFENYLLFYTESTFTVGLAGSKPADQDILYLAGFAGLDVHPGFGIQISIPE
jgi:hypothetical protein